MDRKSFEHLKKKYAQHASWAIWNDGDLEDTTLIGDNLADLKTSVVMVGLNISKPLFGQWRNFHGRDHARKLAYAFNQSPYRGAYMTDLIKSYVEPRSARLRQQLLTGELDVPPHLRTFREEMKDLGANNHSLFVLFHNQVTTIFEAHLAEVYPNRVSCPHYADYAHYTDARWVAKVWSILGSNSEKLSKCSNAPQFSVSAQMQENLSKILRKSSRSSRNVT